MLCGACLFDAMGGRRCQFGALFCGSVLQTCWSVLRRVRNTVRLHVRKRALAARTLAVARTHVGQLYICHKILQFYFPRLEILRIYCHSSQSYSQSSVRAQSELQSELSQSSVRAGVFAREIVILKKSIFPSLLRRLGGSPHFHI